jgi:hypothetical protein
MLRKRKQLCWSVSFSLINLSNFTSGSPIECKCFIAELVQANIKASAHSYLFIRISCIARASDS